MNLKMNLDLSEGLNKRKVEVLSVGKKSNRKYWYHYNNLFQRLKNSIILEGYYLNHGDGVISVYNPKGMKVVEITLEPVLFGSHEWKVCPYIHITDAPEYIEEWFIPELWKEFGCYIGDDRIK